jgi:hypothetical protein
MTMPQTSESEYFIAKAEQCFRLARHIRGDYSQSEVAAELDAIAHEFLARAVEIDTVRDRAETVHRRRQ